jgi:hypothetical protein
MIDDAIAELNTTLAKDDFGGLRPATYQDLELAISTGFPQALIDLYRLGAASSETGMIELNQRIWSVQNAVAENVNYVPGAYLFPLGYVVFASSKSGDAYCLDTIHLNCKGEEQVVLFPHDVMDEGASLNELEKYRLIVAENLEDFLLRFAHRTLINEPKYP